MRNPINVLKSLSEKSQEKSYKYQRLYRNLYNPEFYLLAYQNIYANKGSMTPGVDGMTIDGISMARINRIIESMRNQSYQPKPARREYIVVRQIKRGCFRQIKTVRQEASGKHPVTLLSVYLAHWKKQQATHAD